MHSGGICGECGLGCLLEGRVREGSEAMVGGDPRPPGMKGSPSELCIRLVEKSGFPHCVSVTGEF